MKEKIKKKKKVCSYQLFTATVLEAFSAKNIIMDYNTVMHRSFSVPGKTIQEKRAPNEKRNDFSKATQKINIRSRKHLDLSSGTCPFQRTIPICTFS